VTRRVAAPWEGEAAVRLEFACAPGCRPPSGTREPLVALAGRLAPARLVVQVVVARDGLLRRLNREFGRRDRATDVLSFLYADAVRRRPDGRGPESAAPGAEVYVSLERTAAQARERGHTRAREFVLLVLHGLLHLQGHDHHTPPQARRMRAAEVRALRWLARRWPGIAGLPLLPGELRLAVTAE
jgi:probable rRNA maturation factor